MGGGHRAAVGGRDRGYGAGVGGGHRAAVGGGHGAGVGTGAAAGDGAVERGDAAAGQRQPDQELAARTGVAHGDLAGVRLDDAARDGQAEAAARLRSGGAGRLAAERYVEDARQVIGRGQARPVTQAIPLCTSASTSTPPSAGVCLIALVTRLRRARPISAAST